MRARMDAKRLPVALRAALGLAMVVGLLTMCHAAFSIASNERPASPAVSTSTISADDDGVAATSTAPTEDSAGEGLAGDCALLITCAVALIALGAMLLLRSSRADRVLWQRSAPLRRSDGITSCRVTMTSFIREPAALVC